MENWQLLSWKCIIWQSYPIADTQTLSRTYATYMYIVMAVIKRRALKANGVVYWVYCSAWLRCTHWLRMNQHRRHHSMLDQLSYDTLVVFRLSLAQDLFMLVGFSVLYCNWKDSGCRCILVVYGCHSSLNDDVHTKIWHCCIACNLSQFFHSGLAFT